MDNEIMNQFVKSQLIDLFNSQTKSQIFKSQDRDDTQIDDFDFNINEVSEQQCYDALIEKSQSKIDVQKNKVQDLNQKKEQLKKSLMDLQDEVQRLEEKLQQEKLKSKDARKTISFNQEEEKQIQFKQKQYEQLLKKYEEFIKNESKREMNEIQQEYNNKSNQERIQSNKNINNKKLEERLILEFNQVNQELYEYQNIINPQLQGNLIELQQMMIENDEFSIQKMEVQKNQMLEHLNTIEQDQNNLLYQKLDQAEERLLNIFEIYNKQKKEIEELKQRKNQLYKNIVIGKIKVDSQRSLYKKIKKNQSFKLICLGIIFIIGMQIILNKIGYKQIKIDIVSYFIHICQIIYQDYIQDQNKQITSLSMDQESEQIEQEVQKEIKEEQINEQKNQQVIDYPKTQIEIAITEVIVKDGGLGSKFTQYMIKGTDNLGSFQVYRRYNDFFDLRANLIKKWPGCYIPPIPEKLLGSGNDTETVQIRKRLMEIFLNVLTELPYIYYSEDIQQIFLRSSNTEINKLFQQEKQIKTVDIINRLQSAFPNLDARDSQNSEYMLQISTFQGQLKKSQAYLKQYIEASQAVAQSRKQIQSEKLNLFFRSIPLYEKVILSEYVCGKEDLLVISNPSNIETFMNLLDQLKETYNKFNSIDNITDLFRYELKDAESIQQTLIYREQLLILRANQEQKMREDQAELAKIAAGKQTLTTITNSVFNKAKDQSQLKVEQKISEGQQEIERLQSLYNIITAVIATKEIDKYKQTRINHYHKFLKQVQIQEQKLYECENEILQKIKNECENLMQLQNIQSL
ncbi:unnamed protein product [Paramecium sonneborni]|uniref:PX domain-containing protein n=1 Tax=Paramecium sonneborni TaxID=65129 RepID=A0A8S1KV21_9CILI|nr:unnamed protein product [Paramecium sonneborni]